jgi:predicted dinucleotide-binding enzyme
MRRILEVGLIGSGRIGGTIGSLWVKAGHQAQQARQRAEIDRVFVNPLLANIDRIFAG